MKTIKDILADPKFPYVSENDKAFILAFDETMNKLGYDMGGNYAGKLKFYEAQITYAKTGTKSRTAFARITIQKDHITLRLYFKNIDKHRAYIETAPLHIKQSFVFEGGNCHNCMATCKSMKIYSIDGKNYNKCCHSIATFKNLSVERLPDYIALLTEFYPKIKT